MPPFSRGCRAVAALRRRAPSAPAAAGTSSRASPGRARRHAAVQPLAAAAPASTELPGPRGAGAGGEQPHPGASVRELWLRASLLGEEDGLRGQLRLCGSPQGGRCFFVGDGAVYVSRGVGEWRAQSGGFEAAIDVFQYDALSRSPAPTETQRFVLRSGTPPEAAGAGDLSGDIGWSATSADAPAAPLAVGRWRASLQRPADWPRPSSPPLPALEVRLPPAAEGQPPLEAALRQAATAAATPGALGGALRAASGSAGAARAQALAAALSVRPPSAAAPSAAAPSAGSPAHRRGGPPRYRRPVPGPQHEVGGAVLRSVRYVPDWVSEEEERELLREAYAAPEHLWGQMSAYRRTQEFGEIGKVCGCGRSMLLGPLPAHLQRVADELHAQGVFNPLLFPINSIRANRYDGPGTGIFPHADGPIYFPRVALVSLGSPVVFSFWPTQGNEGSIEWDETHAVPEGGDPSRQPLVSVALMPRSLLLFEGDAFNLHRHGVPYLAEDVVGDLVCNAEQAGLRRGDVLRRGRRIGLTLRHLLPRCGCQPIDPYHALAQ
eukprot:TRINITY_DN26604_c0_g1_i1.p1 TRINITY_DN26604_c0_g1~~TRINITY_DN26604_c0_g1_i1.p1  ORF type:complete len:577 (+),score=149.10 TRINITY_DN26604_c0_g1_i1:85-1731(+)